MIDKERLARAARREVAEHVRCHPGMWVTEITEDINDKDEFIVAVLREFASGTLGRSTTAAKAVAAFAEKAGQSAYDSITGHPGII